MDNGRLSQQLKECCEEKIAIDIIVFFGCYNCPIPTALYDPYGHDSIFFVSSAGRY